MARPSPETPSQGPGIARACHGRRKGGVGGPAGFGGLRPRDRVGESPNQKSGSWGPGTLGRPGSGVPGVGMETSGTLTGTRVVGGELRLGSSQARGLG